MSTRWIKYLSLLRGCQFGLNCASISYWILYLSGAGEPKCKEAKASAAAATAAEVPEFPAAAATAASAAEFPKLPATAELPTAADLPELWCTAATAAAAIFDPPVCTACRICPPAGLWDKGMLEAPG